MAQAASEPSRAYTDRHIGREGTLGEGPVRVTRAGSTPFQTQDSAPLMEVSDACP